MYCKEIIPYHNGISCRVPNICCLKDLWDGHVGLLSLPRFNDWIYYGFYYGPYNYSIFAINEEIEDHYYSFPIKKRNGGQRIIDKPSWILKYYQKEILNNILYCIPCSKYAKAYLPNKSIKDNARFHQGQKIVLTIDVLDFFGSIKSHLVWNVFKRICNYPDSVASLLTNLCVYEGHLPQGAPTSPYLSNIIMHDFDLEIGNYCLSKGIRFTRYADDMTFSGDFDIAALLFFLDKELHRLGLLRNVKKTRVMRQNVRQQTTGIVLNQSCQVPKSYRMQIRQEIHYIKTFGLDSHLERIGGTNKHEYLNGLAGRIRYVLTINPSDKSMQQYKKYIETLIALNKAKI